MGMLRDWRDEVHWECWAEGMNSSGNVKGLEGCFNGNIEELEGWVSMGILSDCRDGFQWECRGTGGMF